MKNLFTKTLLILSFAGMTAAFAAETAAPAVDFKKAFAEANNVYRASKWAEAAKQLEAIRPAAKSAWDKYAIDVRLATCYYNTKEFEKSIAAANEALKYPRLSPKDKIRYVNIIFESLTRLKRLDEAIALADKQLAEPAREDYYYYTTIMDKGVALQMQKKYAQAVETLKKAEGYKGNVVGFATKRDWYLGHCLMQLGDNAAAKTYFEKVAATGKGWFAKNAEKNLKKLAK